jgi:hypothetical protein
MRNHFDTTALVRRPCQKGLPEQSYDTSKPKGESLLQVRTCSLDESGWRIRCEKWQHHESDPA